jgi:predicted negative regulator of RcsB-dependent stress response
MWRKIMILVLTLGLMALLALPAWAAYNEAQVSELQELYQQKKSIEEQIIEKKLEMEVLTAEQANRLKERMNEVYEARREALAEGNFFFKKGMMMRGEGERGFRWKNGGCPMQSPQNTSATY